MTYRPIILCDVDGILADFVGPTLQELHKMGGPRLDYGDIQSWDMFSSIPVEWKERLYALWNTEGWCRGLPVFPGSVEGVRRLREAAEVVFVTSPLHTIYWVEERVAWLQEHFEAKREDVIFTSRKELVLGDLLIEDKLTTAIEWSEGHRAPVALWNWPWNQTTERLPWKVFRVTSWDEIVQVARDQRPSLLRLPFRQPSW